jgi:hypothetical protein
MSKLKQYSDIHLSFDALVWSASIQIDRLEHSARFCIYLLDHVHALSCDSKIHGESSRQRKEKVARCPALCSHLRLAAQSSPPEECAVRVKSV